MPHDRGEGAAATPDKTLLRFLTCGSVDDGKSTLIGRLLFEADVIMGDQLETLKVDSRRFGTTGGDIDFSLLLDGLEDERHQRITIDVAYRFFSTERRSFIIADTPGHEQYTRNMAIGASTADAAVLLIDARKGLLPQTRRHSLICSLFGVRHVVLAVNKLDLMGFDRGVFDAITAEYAKFAADLKFASLTMIPLSARFGDNLTAPSEQTPWYQGPSLLAHLENIEVEDASADGQFRFPVQWVSRPNSDFRGFAGTVAAGSIAVGDPIVAMGSARPSRVKEIVTFDGPLPRASAGDAVTLTLEDEIDVSRGDLLVDPAAPAEFADQFEANVVWMREDPLVPGRSYWLKLGTRTVSATVTGLKHRIDIESGAHVAARTLAINEIGVCNVATSVPLAFDPYAKSRDTGGFILIDRLTLDTAGAGVIDFALRRATNIHWHQSTVTPVQRAELKGHQPAVLWFTGLSGAGKSTIANILEQRLLALGCHTMLLDGDNVRHGLNRDLGFTDTDRVENIRRVGEVARLLGDGGLIAVCAFISPFRADRQMARDIAVPHAFLEVFIDTPIDECIRRDPKGLYAKAQSGEIPNFTGIDSAYEAPENPDIRLTTVGHDAVALADQLIEELRRRGILG
ncbi:MAG TPA: sulfate adenylyltransferase subunit CysN [Stellaceae bacterium]|jgi:bifunctional enzyme CysN/CysC|nr:sulfate adenylyltransferase subunit CysN [Stellaceae bacterium]